MASTESLNTSGSRPSELRVNYYPRYPAHYVAKTLHLTMEQDGAYTRLLDWCYMNEMPVPDDAKYIIARAMSQSEKRAVNLVLSAFFSLENGSWFNGRTTEEIQTAQPKIAAARANGRKGGRPKKAACKDPRDGVLKNPVGFQQEPTTKAPQSPIPSKHQEPCIQEASTGVDPPRVVTSAGLACRLMKSAGCASTNSSHPDLLAALAEGVTAEALAATVSEAVEQGIGKPFAWAIATARGRNREGAKPLPTGSPNHGRPQQLGKTAQGIGILEEMKRGLAGNRDLDGVSEAALPRIGAATRRGGFAGDGGNVG